MSRAATPEARLRSRAWRASNSVWLLTSLLGLGVIGWTGFLYIGLKARRPRWLVAALFWALYAIGLFVLLLRPEEAENTEAVLSFLYLLGGALGQIVHQLFANRGWLKWRAEYPRGSWPAQIPEDPRAAPAFAAAPGAMQPGPARPPAPWGYRAPPLVDINSAGVVELSAELGLPDEWAAAIVETRERLGPYQSVDQLYSRTGLPYDWYIAVQERVMVTLGYGLAVAQGLGGANRAPEGSRPPSVAKSIVGLGAAILFVVFLGNGLETVIDWFRGPERNDVGAVTGAGTEGARDLLVGDCINIPSQAAGVDEALVTDIPVVPCGDPHDAEVYGVFDLPDGDYPGDEDVAVAGDEGCYERFAGYVGASYEESVLDLLFISPTRESWARLDDRKVTCLVGDPNGQARGTLKGAAR